MKLTIIVPDNSVYVDDVAYSKLNLVNIPPNVRVLQWNNSLGHIEFNDGTYNQDINELPTWANDAYNVWSEKYAEIKIAESQAAELLQQTNVILTDNEKLEIIKIERDRRLLASDWTQLPDVPSNIDKNAWAVYRQALRDLPNLPNLNLDNPVYPIPPM